MAALLLAFRLANFLHVNFNKDWPRFVSQQFLFVFCVQLANFVDRLCTVGIREAIPFVVCKWNASDWYCAMYNKRLVARIIW